MRPLALLAALLAGLGCAVALAATHRHHGRLRHRVWKAAPHRVGTPPIPPRRTYSIPTPAPPTGTTTTTTTPPPLPRRLSVDEAEWSVTPSRNPVGTGPVELNVNNLGEDEHDLTVERADGTRVAQTAVIPPGGDTTLTAALPPGTYKLYCSLYGNHEHDRLGMHAELVVK